MTYLPTQLYRWTHEPVNLWTSYQWAMLVTCDMQVNLRHIHPVYLWYSQSCMLICDITMHVNLQHSHVNMFMWTCEIALSVACEIVMQIKTETYPCIWTYVMWIHDKHKAMQFICDIAMQIITETYPCILTYVMWIHDKHKAMQFICDIAMQIITET